MNFLAHCFIAAECASALPPEAARTTARDALIAGGYVGDFVKGGLATPTNEHLPGELRLGIRLHRKVDAISNSLAGITRSCNRFPRAARRLAPVVVDLVADHALAQQWPPQHGPLPDFCSDTYRAIGEYCAFLPHHGLQFFRHARRTDLFARYAHWSVVERAIEHVLQRFSHRYDTAAVLTQTRRLRQPLMADFAAYLPDLLGESRAWFLETNVAPEGR